MRTLSTHVLDAVTGTPAAGVSIRLERRAGEADDSWADLGLVITDDDGRSRGFPELQPGVHRLVFDTAGYFRASGRDCFYPEVAICFAIAAEGHHHVPLLLSPFAYSTYRGS